MKIALQAPWTAERFLAWAETQEAPYEFDGIQPVAMTGGNARHNRIMGNIHAALRARLRGTNCWYFGPDLGVRTVGDAIRYPDALVTCTKVPDSAKIAPQPIVIFEVVSAASGKTDRIIKLREYEAVASLRRYVIVETRSDGLVVLHREDGHAAWSAHALTAGDVLDLTEIGIQIPVADIYEDVTFEDEAATAE